MLEAGDRVTRGCEDRVKHAALQLSLAQCAVSSRGTGSVVQNRKARLLFWFENK